MDLLDRSAVKFGSYRAVAEFLGVTEQHISNIRHGKRQLQPIHAAKLAEALGERWIDHVLPILAGLEPQKADREYWLGKASRLAQTGALVAVLALAGLFNSEKVEASSALPRYSLNESAHCTNGFSGNIQCVYSWIRRRVKRLADRMGFRGQTGNPAYT